MYSRARKGNNGLTIKGKARLWMDTPTPGIEATQGANYDGTATVAEFVYIHGLMPWERSDQTSVAGAWLRQPRLTRILSARDTRELEYSAPGTSTQSSRLSPYGLSPKIAWLRARDGNEVRGGQRPMGFKAQAAWLGAGPIRSSA